MEVEWWWSIDSLKAYKPFSREPLASNVELTKKQINSLIFYKRVIENKNDIEIKEWSKIPDKVLNHIVSYNYDVLSPNTTYCIDDRTKEKQEKWVSISWWTDGLLASAYHYINELWLSWEISAEDIYEALINTIWWLDNYYTHSDTHNINNKWQIWCGHCNVAFNNEWHSIKIPEKYKEFMKSLRRKNKEQKKLDILEGDHNPEGVILIDNSLSPKKLSIIQKWNNLQYFVYNRNAEKNILSRFVEELNKLEGIDIKLNEKELDNISFEAYLSTLEHLNWWNLPHYTIKYNSENWKYRIKSIWDVNTFIKKHKKRLEKR